MENIWKDLSQPKQCTLALCGLRYSQMRGRHYFLKSMGSEVG